MTPMTRTQETRIIDIEQLNQVIYSRITVNTSAITEKVLPAYPNSLGTQGNGISTEVEFQSSGLRRNPSRN